MNLLVQCTRFLSSSFSQSSLPFLPKNGLPACFCFQLSVVCCLCRETTSVGADPEAREVDNTASAWAQLVEGTKGPKFGNVASSSGGSAQHA